MDSLGYRTPSRLTHWDIRPRVDGLTGISDLEEMDKLGISGPKEMDLLGISGPKEMDLLGISGPKEMDLLGISDLGSHVLTNFVFLPGSNTLGSQIFNYKIKYKTLQILYKNLKYSILNR